MPGLCWVILEVLALAFGAATAPTWHARLPLPRLRLCITDTVRITATWTRPTSSPAVTLQHVVQVFVSCRRISSFETPYCAGPVSLKIPPLDQFGVPSARLEMVHVRPGTTADVT